MGQIEDINKRLESMELLLRSINNHIARLTNEGNNVSAGKSPTKIPEMITVREASRRTGLSYDFLRKGCIRGNIVHITVGNGKRLINYDRLIEQLESSHGSIQNE